MLRLIVFFKVGLRVHSREWAGFKLPCVVLRDERCVRFVGQAAGLVVRQTRSSARGFILRLSYQFSLFTSHSHGPLLLLTTPPDITLKYGQSVHQPPSASINLHQPPSASIIVHHRPSSSISIHQPPSSSISLHQPPSASIIVYQPPSASIIVHQPPSASIRLYNLE